MKPLNCIALLFCLLCQTTFSQTRFIENPLLLTENKAQKSLFDTWQEESVLSLRLEADFTQLIANKNNDEYQDAELTIHPKADNAYTTTAKVKVRGKYRRRVCDFPPLKLKLTESMVGGIATGNYKTFKLVTHCSNDGATKETVLREYLTYKMYAALTGQSFRVQLVEMLYVDQGETLPKLKRYGFLLEDTDELEDRLQADDCDCAFSTQSDQSQNSAAQMALFQFMIGNNDWAINVPKNTKVLKVRNQDEQIVIPYDFDFSAIVNAPYAYPNVDYKLQDIRDRVLQIDGIDTAALDRVVVLFRQKKAILLDIIQSQQGLSRTAKKEMTDYVQHFYTLLDQGMSWNHQMVVPFEAKEK